MKGVNLTFSYNLNILKHLPWSCVLVAAIPLVGLRIAGVFTVLLCTW